MFFSIQINGNCNKSCSDSFCSASAWKVFPAIRISWKSQRRVVFSVLSVTVGVVITAKSASPLCTAWIACGVEWLYSFNCTLGYAIWNFFNFSSRKIFRAISLALIETQPFSNSALSVNSSSAANICIIAAETCRKSFSPSSVNRTPRFVRMNKVQCISRSRQFIARVILGWLLCKACAAFVKFRYFAT